MPRPTTLISLIITLSMISGISGLDAQGRQRYYTGYEQRTRQVNAHDCNCEKCGAGSCKV